MLSLTDCANAVQLRDHFYDEDNNLHLVMEPRNIQDNLFWKLQRDGPMSEHEACMLVSGAHGHGMGIGRVAVSL